MTSISFLRSALFLPLFAVCTLALIAEISAEEAEESVASKACSALNEDAARDESKLTETTKTDLQAKCKLLKLGGVPLQEIGANKTEEVEATTRPASRKAGTESEPEATTTTAAASRRIGGYEGAELDDAAPRASAVASSIPQAPSTQAVAAINAQSRANIEQLDRRDFDAGQADLAGGKINPGLLSNPNYAAGAQTVEEVQNKILANFPPAATVAPATAEVTAAGLAAPTAPEVANKPAEPAPATSTPAVAEVAGTETAKAVAEVGPTAETPKTVEEVAAAAQETASKKATDLLNEGYFSRNAKDAAKISLQYCREEGYDEQVCASAMRVIQKESRFNHTAQNGTSSAFGLGQYINSTWKGECTKFLNMSAAECGSLRADPQTQLDTLFESTQRRYDKFTDGNLDCRGLSFDACNYIVYHHSGSWANPNYIAIGSNYYNKSAAGGDNAYREAFAGLATTNPEVAMAQLSLTATSGATWAGSNGFSVTGSSGNTRVSALNYNTGGSSLGAYENYGSVNNYPSPQAAWGYNGYPTFAMNQPLQQPIYTPTQAAGADLPLTTGSIADPNNTAVNATVPQAPTPLAQTLPEAPKATTAGTERGLERVLKEAGLNPTLNTTGLPATNPNATESPAGTPPTELRGFDALTKGVTG